MKFSPQQERALAKVERWLDSDVQVFYMAGYAGTGKTTLARYLDATHYAAFTGKAASVLRSKGCHGAGTIHGLIYNPRERSTKRLHELLVEQQDSPTRERAMEIERERENLRRPSFTLNLDSALRGSRLLVIDECSMVNEQIGTDLLSFGTKVLVLGDPAQLPPVKGGGFFTEREPDVLLTEVHRQARGNPILDLATTIRTTGRLPRSHSLVRPRSSLQAEDVLGVDQLIVGRNTTRHATNQRMRELLGFTGSSPQPGERVVCLKNNHQEGLLNGVLYEVDWCNEYGPDEPLELRVSNEDNVHECIWAYREPFVGEEPDWRHDPDMNKFDFGYALTCHKSQGSQWNRVGVFDESGAFRQHAARWLYTAVTRAAEELWIAV